MRYLLVSESGHSTRAPALKDNLKHNGRQLRARWKVIKTSKGAFAVDICVKFVYNSNACIFMLLFHFILQVGRDDMSEQAKEKKENLTSPRLHLLSKELEDATNEFLFKMSELEKLLPLIDE
jgi:hypothetical protein